MTRTDMLNRLGVVCDCAAKPPTIPLYRAPHDHLPDCPMGHWLANQAGLAWAREMLKDPARASIEMSGMADADLDELRREFGMSGEANRD